MPDVKRDAAIASCALMIVKHGDDRQNDKVAYAEERIRYMLSELAQQSDIGFDLWWYSVERRCKYDRDHPVYLAARDVWHQLGGVRPQVQSGDVDVTLKRYNIHVDPADLFVSAVQHLQGAYVLADDAIERMDVYLQKYGDAQREIASRDEAFSELQRNYEALATMNRELQVRLQKAEGKLSPRVEIPHDQLPNCPEGGKCTGNCDHCRT